MSIAKETLEKWRTEALISLSNIDNIENEGQRVIIEEPNKRVLFLTQVLIDHHLLGGYLKNGILRSKP